MAHGLGLETGLVPFAVAGAGCPAPARLTRSYPRAMAHGLELETVLVPFAVVGAGCLALAGFIGYVRLRGPRLVDCHEVTVVSESPVTAIDRIEHAVRGQDHYS